MEQDSGKPDPNSWNSATTPMAQCEVSGEWVPVDEMVSFQGRRVSAAGKRILLDRLSAGESPEEGSAGIVAIARAQRRLLKLVLIFILGILILIALAVAGSSVSSPVAAPAPVNAKPIHFEAYIFLIVIGLGYLVMLVLYLIALYRLAHACGSRWAWLYVVAQFMSLLGLVALLVLISKSNRMLREAGLRVGLLGVKKSEIEAMANRIPQL